MTFFFLILILTRIGNPVTQMCVVRRTTNWFSEILMNDFQQNFELEFPIQSR